MRALGLFPLIHILRSVIGALVYIADAFIANEHQRTNNVKGSNFDIPIQVNQSTQMQ